MWSYTGVSVSENDDDKAQSRLFDLYIVCTWKNRVFFLPWQSNSDFDICVFVIVSFIGVDTRNRKHLNQIEVIPSLFGYLCTNVKTINMVRYCTLWYIFDWSYNNLIHPQSTYIVRWKFMEVNTDRERECLILVQWKSEEKIYKLINARHCVNYSIGILNVLMCLCGI